VESTIALSRATKDYVVHAKCGFPLAAIAAKLRKISSVVIVVMSWRAAIHTSQKTDQPLSSIGLAYSNVPMHAVDCLIVESIAVKSLATNRTITLLIVPVLLTSLLTARAVKRASVRYRTRPGKPARIRYLIAPSRAESS
jgi:hypothetical protein